MTASNKHVINVNELPTRLARLNDYDKMLQAPNDWLKENLYSIKAIESINIKQVARQNKKMIMDGWMCIIPESIEFPHEPLILHVTSDKGFSKREASLYELYLIDEEEQLFLGRKKLTLYDISHEIEFSEDLEMINSDISPEEREMIHEALKVVLSMKIKSGIDYLPNNIRESLVFQ